MDEQTSKALLDILQAAGVVLGGIGAALITSRFTRKSQAESNKISEANGLVERYNTFVEAVQADRATERERTRHLEDQVGLWRRWANKLRNQIYELGGRPVEAPEELDL